MRKNNLVWQFLGAVAAAAALFVIFNLTNPLSVGPAGILSVLGLIFLFCWFAIWLVAEVAFAIWRMIRPEKSLPTAMPDPKKREKIRRRRVKWIAAMLALIPIFVISLNSIGQLNISQYILILLIEFLGIFYILRRIR